MEIAKKFLKLLDLVFVAFKVTTRDMYVIPCAHIKELLAVALMITAVNLTAMFIGMPVFLDYRGCVFGTAILAAVYLFTAKKGTA